MEHHDPPRYREADLLPDPFWAADRAAVEGQDIALLGYMMQLAFTVAAAVAGALPVRQLGPVNVTPLVSVGLFLMAGCVAVALHFRAPQEEWYQGRSTAESVKALTWKYVVRAHPFEGEAENTAATQRFRDRIGDVTAPAPGAAPLPDVAPDRVITAPMRAGRAAPLKQRRELYLTDRVDAQRSWYLDRANECDHKALIWWLLTTSMFCGGIIMAVLEATDYPSLRVLGSFSAAAAAMSAWSQLKQFRPLASSYRLAASELDRIARLLIRLDVTRPDAETVWAELARDAEDAISREHIVWRARSQHRV
jgi:hypothetical protein